MGMAGEGERNGGFTQHFVFPEPRVMGEKYCKTLRWNAFHCLIQICKMKPSNLTVIFYSNNGQRGC